MPADANKELFPSANNNAKFKQEPDSAVPLKYNNHYDTVAQAKNPSINGHNIDLIVETDVHGDPQNTIGEVYFNENSKSQSKSKAVSCFKIVLVA